MCHIMRFCVCLILLISYLTWHTLVHIVSVYCGKADKTLRYSGSGCRTRRRKSWASGLRHVTSGVSQLRVPSPTFSSVARSDSPAKGQRHVRLSTTCHKTHKTTFPNESILYYDCNAEAWKSMPGHGFSGTYHR